MPPRRTLEEAERDLRAANQYAKNYKTPFTGLRTSPPVGPSGSAFGPEFGVEITRSNNPLATAGRFLGRVASTATGAYYGDRSQGWIPRAARSVASGVTGGLAGQSPEPAVGANDPRFIPDPQPEQSLPPIGPEPAVPPSQVLGRGQVRIGDGPSMSAGDAIAGLEARSRFLPPARSGTIGSPEYNIAGGGSPRDAALAYGLNRADYTPAEAAKARINRIGKTSMGRNARKAALEAEMKAQAEMDKPIMAREQMAAQERMAGMAADAQKATVQGDMAKAQMNYESRMNAAGMGAQARVLSAQIQAQAQEGRTTAQMMSSAIAELQKMRPDAFEEDEKGHVPADAVVDYIMQLRGGQAGQYETQRDTDEQIRQQQVGEAPGIDRFDSDQSGDLDTQQEMDEAQKFATGVLSKFSQMDKTQQAKYATDKRVLLAKAIQAKLAQKAKEQANAMVR